MAHVHELIPAPSRRVTGAVLALLMMATAALLVAGVTRDLPSPEPDEPFFVLPAVNMAAHDSLDPGWFGHPGSTVILPLALVYRAREVVFHGAPVTGTASSVLRRYREDPSSFYLIGRIWALVLTVATVPLVYLLGRRIHSSLVGLLGAAVWALVPMVLEYGRLVRTDAAATCFGMLALLAALRALERPSAARFSLAGAAIGVAVATRWFMLTLVVVLVGAWWCTRRDPLGTDAPSDGQSARTSRASWSRLLFGGAAALVAFAALTPYFFLDWRAVRQSVLAEEGGHFASVSHGPIDNVSYYLFHALPDALSWPVYLMAVVGLVLLVLRRRRPGVLTVVFVLAFVAALLPLPLHWQRWLIPVFPLLVLSAVCAVCTVAALLTNPATSPARRVAGRAGAITIGITAMIAVMAVASAFDTYAATVPTTRTAMRHDVARDVPNGAKVAVEVKGPSLGDIGYRTYHAFDLPRNGTIADYVAHGYHYFVVNTYVALQYRLHSNRWRDHAAFYQFLRWHGKLLADERPADARQGPHLKLYRVDDAELQRHVGRPARATTLRSTHDRVGTPSHEYPASGRRFDQRA
jgi:hypothetical protein